MSSPCKVQLLSSTLFTYCCNYGHLKCRVRCYCGSRNRLSGHALLRDRRSSAVTSREALDLTRLTCQLWDKSNVHFMFSIVYLFHRKTLAIGGQMKGVLRSSVTQPTAHDPAVTMDILPRNLFRNLLSVPLYNAKIVNGVVNFFFH